MDEKEKLKIFCGNGIMDQIKLPKYPPITREEVLKRAKTLFEQDDPCTYDAIKKFFQ